MVERIREILSRRQLTPTQFADAIGVARPIVSHILSGRNKPSLEVVQKIISAFPDLSLPWLLSGTGPMVAVATLSQENSQKSQQSVAERLSKIPKAEESSSEPSVVAQKPAEVAQTEAPRTVSTPVATATQLDRAKDTDILTSPAAVAPLAPVAEQTTILSQAPATPAPRPSSATVESAPSGRSKETEAVLQAFAEPNKTIRRIVIFYHDGTFSDYRPEASNS